ncbi:hypothetical protein L9F63_007308 [Diploptera punctata]|uniref:Uncharacterized protein n=1 Tax=Diploptera punctata TaxID=6984 RepID=A0AAD7Z8Q8_DIPPU|nr:hypothetical protein L9F63_007308 [Diploptera punctata]
MMARVLHNRQKNVSSAIFGALSTSVSTSTSNEDKTLKGNKQISTTKKSELKPVKNVGAKLKQRKLPEIKHNLASKLRMVKANPLLEERGIITLPEKYKKGLERIDKKNKRRSSRIDNPSKSVGKHNVGRRSLSVDGSCKKLADSRTQEENSKIKRFHSVTGLNIPVMEGEEEFENEIFPLPLTPVNIQTPHKSRYASLTNSVGRKSMISPSTLYTPTPEVMRKQLSDWLKKRGKSFGSFHHLQCFGLHANNKTSSFRKSILCATPNMSNKCSKKPLVSEEEPCSSAMTQPPAALYSGEIRENSVSENKENEYTQNYGTIPTDALEDLINVIKLGYPLEKCNQWLTLICQSFPSVKEVPVYWECFALVEEARGDLKSAVDCYERAIIRGAPPEKVSDSLDQLMEKFNLLNIYPNVHKDGSGETPRKLVLDARNIFKSTIIRFALQQKAVRSLSTNLGVPATSLNYIATPVRRSTRPSSSRYSVTPGVLCLKSLNQLEPEIRKSVIFEPNNAFN